jgi:hypothetical protein
MYATMSSALSLFIPMVSFSVMCTEITPRQDVCIICKTETNDGSKTVHLTEKETIGMNKERGDDIVAYINPIVIKGLKKHVECLCLCESL